MSNVINPIIPGFYPDPSIIRVEDDFYIVNSSFEYFPSIPIWHSKDLAHWKQIGHVISSQDQGLDLSDVLPSGGVQAPTIRYHNNTFYVTSTRVKKYWPSNRYHFIVTAKNIKGPWSKCHFIDDAEGIDSSLFFDGDKAYFLANREKNDAKSGTDTEIWMSEIDLNTFTLVGEKHVLWDGTGGIYPEGPRLFKRHGYYYLIVSEGGTLHNHTVTIARSDNIFGPYISSPRNPILTHKHLSRTYPIQNVGHADIVELKDGSWVGVCLGSRPRGGFYDGGNTIYSFGGYYRNLGRETFLFPVEWPKDDLSPLFSPYTGKIEMTYDMPALRTAIKTSHQVETLLTLKDKWVTIRNEDHASLYSYENDVLSLILKPTIEHSFLGVRQTSWTMDNSFELDLSQLKDGDMVGIAAYIKKGNYLALEIVKKEMFIASIVSVINERKITLLKKAFTKDVIRINVHIKDQDYTFSMPQMEFQKTLDGRPISCDLNDAHTGVMIACIGESEYSSTIRVLNANLNTLLT